MIVLENGDKLRGDAAVIGVIDYSIHGFDNKSIAQLADGQLPSSTGDLFTADSTDIVKTVILVNTDTSAITVNLFILPNGGTNRRIIAKDFLLGSGHSLHTDGERVTVLNPTGGIVISYVTHSATHTNGTDDIQSATNAQKGLATGAHIQAIEANSAKTGVTTQISNIVEDTTPQLGGPLEINEKTILVNAALSADGTWTGPTQIITAGEDLTIGEVCYLKSDGKYWLADADAEATADTKLVMATASISADATGVVLLPSALSFIRVDATTEWTVTGAGDVMYLSTVAGELTNDISGYTTGDIIRVCGYMETATILNFKVSDVFVEVE